MKKYRKISMKKTGKTRRRRRRRQEKHKKILEGAKRYKNIQKVIATELTVNSSISTLGMVYTLL